MSPTYGTIPHRLIPGISVSVGAQHEGLTWTNTNAGGFDRASWTQRVPPDFSEGDPVTIATSDGVFQGKVTSIGTGVGEQLRWDVQCRGHVEDRKKNETREGVFADRDLSQWQAISSGQWSLCPDLEIQAQQVGNYLAVYWPALEDGKLIVDRSDPKTFYDHVGNALPRHHISDFPRMKPVWAAWVYQLGGGKTSQQVSSFSFLPFWTLETPLLDAMTTPDYTNPIGPADAKYGHRHAKYPKIPYWTTFYGMNHAPTTALFGIYACDDVSELPTGDPFAMRYDPHLVWKPADRTSLTYSPDSWRTIHTAHNCIVAYASYVPVMMPMNRGYRYSKAADHLVRTDWVAETRLYAEPGLSLYLANVAVCAQGYEPLGPGYDDLGRVFRIAFPGCDVAMMPLPARDDNGAPQSIAVRERTSDPDMVAQLLALWKDELCWGFWEDDQLVIASPTETFSVSDVPGVDTTGAAKTSEGAVDLVLVAYSAFYTDATAGGVLTMPKVKYIVVDKDGVYEEVAAGWTPEDGLAVAYEDATDRAGTPAAAARIGQRIAVQRRPEQWSGSVVLRAIEGAAEVRPGTLLSAPGIEGALITQTSCSVDSDTVTLTLGPSGYVGRFAPAVPGKPLTASPMPGPRKGR